MLAAANLVRPTEGKWEDSAFVAGGNGHGGAVGCAVLALVAGWPALASTETLAGSSGWWLLFGGFGWFLGLGTLLLHRNKPQRPFSDIRGMLF